MTTMFPDKRPIAVLADDWSIDDGPTDIDHAFGVYRAWVIGFLIRDTEDSITIVMEIFGDGKVRKAQTIPKAVIKEIVSLIPTVPVEGQTGG